MLTKEEALEELKDIIDSFEDMSGSEEDRQDFYLDRLIAVYESLNSI